jgi:hypothetical protein
VSEWAETGEGRCGQKKDNYFWNSQPEKAISRQSRGRTGLERRTSSDRRGPALAMVEQKNSFNESEMALFLRVHAVVCPKNCLAPPTHFQRGDLSIVEKPPRFFVSPHRSIDKGVTGSFHIYR